MKFIRIINKIILIAIVSFIINTSVHNIYAQNYIMDNAIKNNYIAENYESKENEKSIFLQKLNKYATIGTIVLTIYWIILLYKYEYDKKYVVSNIDEDELFEKFNPLLAGCIEGNRTVISKDLLAIILNLVNKKFLDLEIKSISNEKDKYEYILTVNKEYKGELDQIETYIFDMIFEGKYTINLAERLKKIPRDSNIDKKFENLNNIVIRELNNKGANKNKVPDKLQIFNSIILILSIIYTISMAFYATSRQPFLKVVFGIGFLCLLATPFWIMNYSVLIAIIRKIPTKIFPNTPRWVTTTITIPITITLMCTLCFGSLLSFLISFYEIQIIQYILLIAISAIIAFTDNIMLKNDIKMIEYYSKLHALKQKIENTLLYDKDIEYITLWDKYFTYAISFGITKKANKRISVIDLNDDLFPFL